MREKLDITESLNSRLQAELDSSIAERAYLSAERQLLVAQLRHLVLQLSSSAAAAAATDAFGGMGAAAQGTTVAAAAWATMSAAAHEEDAVHAVRESERKLSVAAEQLPQHSSLWVLGGPCEVFHDVAALLEGLQHVLRVRQMKVDELERGVEVATEALQQQERERQMLEQQLAVAMVASSGGLGGSGGGGDKAVAAKLRKKFEQKLQQLVSLTTGWWDDNSIEVYGCWLSPCLVIQL